LWRVRFISSQRESSLDNTIDEHREIVEALLRRDANVAATCLRRHLTTAVSNIALTFQERDACASNSE